MADQALVPVALVPNVASAAVAALATGVAALTTGNDGLITPTSDKMVIVLFDADGGGSTVLIKAGTDAPLSSQGDISVVLAGGQTKAIYVESARVKAQSGSDKGKIRIDCAANVTAWAYALP
jgi:acid phosphatase family membrane protein YuiD